MIPLASIISTILAARLYPTRSCLCSIEADACCEETTRSMAFGSSSSASPASCGVLAFSIVCITSSAYPVSSTCPFINSITSWTSESEIKVPCTRIGFPPPIGLKSMSPFPTSFSAPAISSMVLESNWDDTANAIRDGIFALITPVITSTDGLWVATIKCIPAALAFCASLHMDSST